MFKTRNVLFSISSVALLAGLWLISNADRPEIKPEHCVFNNVFGIVEYDTLSTIALPEKSKPIIKDGLSWLINAQHPDGGWGAGFHHAQKEMNPHAVPPDPATTAMVSMALLRTGTRLDQGTHQNTLYKATEFILNAIEQTANDQTKITELTGTQIQNKLGQNIDVVLALQFLNNLYDQRSEDHSFYPRIKNAIVKGAKIVEKSMDQSGKMKGAGWAGVLQSAYALNALESSKVAGAPIDDNILQNAKKYQKENYNPVSSEVNTRNGAGVMLYAVAGSVRASAPEARKARAIIKDAKEDGRLEAEEEINYENLIKAGLDEKQALEYDAANKIYESAKIKAQQKEVMSGFGNNGGEEFLSFLQTGESLIVNQDESWTEWYDQMSANLMNIQNDDGSWNGHHCITSPVFCTASCIMILSIHNDIEMLSSISN